MTKLLSRLDQWMRRFERAAWVTLGLSAFAIPWFGLEPTLQAEPDALGRGYIWLDWTLAVMMLAATAAALAMSGTRVRRCA